MNKNQRLDRIRTALVYICLDSRRSSATDTMCEECLRIAEKALQGGVSIIQLRDKDSRAEKEYGKLSPTDTFVLSGKLRELCHAYNGLFAINDNPQLAVDVQADICHVGQTDMTPHQVRTIVGPDVIIGQSSHTIEQASAAQRNPEVDYFCIGPVWATPTKPGRPGVGLETIREFTSLYPQEDLKPWFAIGGIDTQNISDIAAAGARKCVVVRAVNDAPEPTQAAQQLYQCLHNQVPAGGNA